MKNRIHAHDISKEQRWYKVDSYHRLGALYESSDGAFQMGIFSWSVSEDKDLRGGWSSSQGKLVIVNGTGKSVIY